MSNRVVVWVRASLALAGFVGLAQGCAEGVAMPEEGVGMQMLAPDGGVTDGTGSAGQMPPGDGMLFMGVACEIGLPEPCQCEDGQIGFQTCEPNPMSPSGAAVTGCGMCGMALGNLPGDTGGAGMGAMDGAAGTGSMDPMMMDPGVMTPPPDSGMDNTRMCDPTACPAPLLGNACCKMDGSCGAVDLFMNCV